MLDNVDVIASETQILADMSHAIRRQLNAISGMAHLLETTELTDEQAGYVRAITVSSQALNALISDSLELSKIDAGGLTINRTEFQLREVIGMAAPSAAATALAPLHPGQAFAISAETNSAAKDHQSVAHGQRVELVVNFTNDLPDHVIGDAGRLRQVVAILASNAIQVSPEGGDVVVRLFADELSESHCRLHVSVRDSSSGIHADKVEHVFDAFQVLGPWQERALIGPGLGLPLVKRIVNAIGGEVWCESQLGFGSTFHFVVTLDLAPATVDFESDAARETLAGR